MKSDKHTLNLLNDAQNQYFYGKEEVIKMGKNYNVLLLRCRLYKNKQEEEEKKECGEEENIH